MSMHATRAQLLCLATLCAVVAWDGGTHARAASARWLVAFELPSEHVLHELATAKHLDVRWVEQDLVLAEVSRPDDVPNLWGGRVLGRRDPGQELALLHGRNADALRARAHTSKALRRLSASRVATLHGARDEVWVLLAPAGEWPAEVQGCHGGLVLARHNLDPRSLIASGPPRPLLPWVLAPDRDWTPAEDAVLSAVSEDSIVAFFDLLTKNQIGLPADRYVFSPDLQNVYIPRVQAVMQKAVAGIPGASVELQPFDKTRRCPNGNGTVVDSMTTANLIARMPGSIPGTGTFVVCAHIDATGSSDPIWVQEARDNCDPPSQTPGGEDNASGVAAMLEVLRCIADGVAAGTIDFAFDLEFVAFSGEEAEGSGTGGLKGFLTGSEHYVRERSAAGDTFLAVFNLDMIGSDSLGTRLQLVHNAASEWFADFAAKAVGLVDSLDLTPRLERDEALSSDHNSFWAVNATAILGADAPVETLCRYATYHRRLDTGFDQDVRAWKMREVTRAVVATLLRFDTNVHAAPALFVEPMRTSFALQGDEQPYNHRAWRVFAGDPVYVTLKLFNLGAQYIGPVRLSLRKERQDGTSVIVTDLTSQRNLPTGGLASFREPIPILAGDSGITRVVATVGWDSSNTTFVDTLAVRGRHKPEVAAFRPNPARDLREAQLLMELSEPGTVSVRLYNLEGEEVYRGSETVARTPLIRPGEEPVLTAVPLGSASTRLLDLVSGAYFARVWFEGDDGSRASSSARLVIVR